MRSTPRLVQFAALLALASGPPARGADCLRAIFFDLGSTLVDQTNPAPYPLFPTAQATIDSLQARGLALGIITNVPAGWDRGDLEALLAQPAFLDEFDVLVLSSQAPAAKPDPAIYTHAYNQLALPRPVIAATAFVGETIGEIGNTVLNPTLGARAIGMTGIHLSNAAPNPIADVTIATLDDLLAVESAPCSFLVDGFESADAAAWSSCAGCP